MLTRCVQESPLTLFRALLYSITWSQVTQGLMSPIGAMMTVFALAVMEYAVGVSKFGKNPKTLLVHQY